MYLDLRVSQSVMSMRRQYSESYDPSTGQYIGRRDGSEFYPTEIGLQLGIGW